MSSPRKRGSLIIVLAWVILLIPARARADFPGELQFGYTAVWLRPYSFKDTGAGLIDVETHPNGAVHGGDFSMTFTRRDKVGVFLGNALAFGFAGSASVTSARIDPSTYKGRGFGPGALGSDMTIPVLFRENVLIGITAPLSVLTFSAGAGAGFSLWAVTPSDSTDTGDFMFSSTLELPLWARVSISPACGFEIVASADYQVGVQSISGGQLGRYPVFGVSLGWEGACAMRRSERAQAQAEADAQSAQERARKESEAERARKVEARARKAEEQERFVKLAEAWRATDPKPNLSEAGNREWILAEAAFQDKDLDGTTKHFQNALRTDPMWPDGNFNVALLFSEQKDWASAAYYMKRYLLLVPDAPDSQAAGEMLIIWEDKASRQP